MEAGVESEREGRRGRPLARRGQVTTWGAWAVLLAVVEGVAVLGARDEAVKLDASVLKAIDTDAGQPAGREACGASKVSRAPTGSLPLDGGALTQLEFGHLEHPPWPILSSSPLLKLGGTD